MDRRNFIKATGTLVAATVAPATTAAATTAPATTTAPAAATTAPIATAAPAAATAAQVTTAAPAAATAASAALATAGRQILPLNRGWRYSAKRVEGAQDKDFDDSGFERVAVPHTNIRLPWHSFDEKS